MVMAVGIFSIVEIAVIAVALAAHQVNAQCSRVELLADERSLATTTLYKPLGSSAFVSCRCAGSGTPIWTYSNGTAVPSCTSLYSAVCSDGVYLGSQNLTFSSLTYSLAGSYDCTESAYSTRVSIAILGPPVITDHPTGGDVPMGRSITLMCRASGLGTLVYSWERSSSGSSWTTVSNDNTTSYTTNSNMAVGEYMYRCRVSNEAGSVMSNSVTVNVYGPPIITTHPTSQLTTVSMSITLNCKGTGRGSITYQWQNRNINGGQWRDISNSNKRKLVVRNLQESQRYSCVVSNEVGGTRSNVSTVSVLKITTHPQDRLVPVGSSVSLTCTSSVSSDVTFSWTHNGRDVTGQSTSTGDTSILIITSMRSSDDGSYVCAVRSGSLSVMSDSAILTSYGPPTITIHPTSQLTTVSMSVTLNCEGTGRGSITYQWQNRNINGGQWRDISNSNNRRLVRNLQDSQHYRCVVSNEAGGTRSNIATVTVLKITLHPTSTTVIALRDVTLTCSSSVYDAAYSWHRDGGSVPSRSRTQGRNTDTLTIREATPPDEGMYYCMASKEGINVESRRARIDVDDQLSIIVTPTDPAVGVGGTAQFTATASGVNMSNFVYQWRKSGSRLPIKVSGVNGTALKIPNLVESDEGVYYCTVTNQWGNSERSGDINLTVIADLTIFWRHPQDLFINNDDDVTFKCFANSTNATIIIIAWEKDTIPYTSGVTQATTHGNGVSSSLTLNRATVADSGKYRCRANNSNGESTASNEVKLIILPDILTNPNDVIVLIGQSTQLTCSALGTDIVYQWFKDDTVVFGANSNMLRITNIEESDEGVYKCVVSNKGGEVESDIAIITVYGLPVVRELPQQVHVVLDEEFQITCTATNDQDARTNLTLSWMAPKGVAFDETATDEDDSRTASSTLHVSSVTNNDGGQYQCSVSNDGGNAVATSTLIVEAPSSRPRTPNVFQANISSLELTWNTPRRPRGEIDYYTVYYNTSDQPVQVVIVTNFTGTYTLDNLRPYTEYSVYVTAVRLIGTNGKPLEGEMSDAITARTLAGAPIILPAVNTNQPELIINTQPASIRSYFTVDMPSISVDNGPFSYLYIIVVTRECVVATFNSIVSKELLEESARTCPLFYVAGVVNASQYVPGHRMSYILGAGDNTTDPDGHVFYNREVERSHWYFIRVFSAASSPENEISTITGIQQIQPQNDNSSDGESSNDSNLVVIAVLVVLLVIVIICNVVQGVLYYKLKKQRLKSEIVAPNVKQALQQEYKPDEAAYEIVDKSCDVKMDSNPAYAVQEETSMNNQYVNVPKRQAKVKQ